MSRNILKSTKFFENEFSIGKKSKKIQIYHKSCMRNNCYISTMQFQLLALLHSAHVFLLISSSFSCFSWDYYVFITLLWNHIAYSYFFESWATIFPVKLSLHFQVLTVFLNQYNCNVYLIIKTSCGLTAFIDNIPSIFNATFNHVHYACTGWTTETHFKCYLCKKYIIGRKI